MINCVNLSISIVSLTELESVWWQDRLIETISHLHANLSIARQWEEDIHEYYR